MKGFLKFLAICAAIAASIYVAYLLIFPSVTLRYRLTVDVDVDGVVHTGSGVVEVFYQPLPDSLVGIGGGRQFGGSVRGYAITIDLGERGLLFVVNYSSTWSSGRRLPDGNPDLSLLPLAVYGQHLDGRPSEMLRIARELKQKNGSVEIPLVKLPMIGRFRNINGGDGFFQDLDPLNISAVYGPRVQLVNAEFEFTNDPISPMPSLWPAWLKADTDDAYRSGNSPHLFHPSMYAFKGN